MHQLTLKSDGSELLEYDYPDFPIRCRSGSLGIFADYAAVCHWHRDFEFLQALDGEMDYFVNGERIHLKNNQAIFINSGRLHYGYSEAHTDCNYRFIVYDPLLLGAYSPIGTALERLTANSTRDWWLLDGSTREGAKALACLETAGQASKDQDTLLMLAQCAVLTHIIYQLSQLSSCPEHNEQWETVRKMVGFIQEHYAEPMTLAAIAASGAVCRSRCCKLFREKLGVTPGLYIMKYRLNKACELIKEGKAFSEVAHSCGFHSASYFAESFKKMYGITPRNYKETHFHK